MSNESTTPNPPEAAPAKWRELEKNEVTCKGDEWTFRAEATATWFVEELPGKTVAEHQAEFAGWGPRYRRRVPTAQPASPQVATMGQEKGEAQSLRVAAHEAFLEKHGIIAHSPAPQGQPSAEELAQLLQKDALIAVVLDTAWSKNARLKALNQLLNIDATTLRRLAAATKELREERDRLVAQRDNLLKPVRDIAIERAERAEADLKSCMKVLDPKNDRTVMQLFLVAEREVIELKGKLVDATATAERERLDKEKAEKLMGLKNAALLVLAQHGLAGHERDTQYEQYVRQTATDALSLTAESVKEGGV